MASSMSKAAIDRLGKRLADAVEPSAEDLHALSEVQALWLPALDAALAVVSDVVAKAPIPMHVSHRKKTVSTLLDKIRRGTPLSSMQDVVGIRIVGAMVNPAKQNDIVGALVSRFDRPKVTDRRAKPTHGYRAVHVIPKVDGHPVEIQVRTGFQHAWANATESIADRWGRGIRYGDPPSGADPDEVARRVDALAHWTAASDAIAAIEAGMSQTVERLRAQPAPADPDDSGSIIAELADPLLEAIVGFQREMAASGVEIAESFQEALREVRLLLERRRP